jgi:hypothetical protein
LRISAHTTFQRSSANNDVGGKVKMAAPCAIMNRARSRFSGTSGGSGGTNTCWNNLSIALISAFNAIAIIFFIKELQIAKETVV